MTNEKKFLDQSGVQYLWSKVSMEDYPNNETLIAVLNAIDETKANKSDLDAYLKIEDYNASGLSIQKMTQENYDSLAVKDPNTLYIII